MSLIRIHTIIILISCATGNVWGQSTGYWHEQATEAQKNHSPVFKTKPADQLAATGDDVTMTCTLLEEDDLAVNWRRDDGAPLPLGRYKVLEDRSLILTDLKPDDQGVYICSASNKFGTSEASAKLTIHSPPRFLIKPKNKLAVVGKQVKLRCSVAGNPQPSLFWSKNEMLLFQDQVMDRFSVDAEGSLQITDVQISDTGLYECNALSTAGTLSAPAQLKVMESDPNSSCKDWRGRTVFEGDRFYPDFTDLCFRCRCLNATAQHCKTRTCNPPTDPCAIWQKVPEECCRYTCIQRHLVVHMDTKDSRSYRTEAPQLDVQMETLENKKTNSAEGIPNVTSLIVTLLYIIVAAILTT